MKRRTLLSGSIGLLLSIIIIVLGLAAPLFLLNKKETTLLKRMFLVNATSTTTFINNPNISTKEQLRPDVIVNELSLYEKLYIWDNGIENLPRAPFDYELNMEEAAKKARNEIEHLVYIGAIPKLPFDDYTLQQAELLSVTGQKPKTMQGADNTIEPLTNIGRWSIEFSDVKNDAQITVICDSVTSKIYVMQVVVPLEASGISSRMLLESFAKYHELANESREMDYSENGMTLNIDNFILNYLALNETTSTSAYILSISIKK